MITMSVLFQYLWPNRLRVLLRHLWSLWHLLLSAEYFLYVICFQSMLVSFLITIVLILSIHAWWLLFNLDGNTSMMRSCLGLKSWLYTCRTVWLRFLVWYFNLVGILFTIYNRAVRIFKVFRFRILLALS